jgi:hypothetical protein
MDLAERNDQVEAVQDLFPIDSSREATHLECCGHAGSQFT